MSVISFPSSLLLSLSCSSDPLIKTPILSVIKNVMNCS
jgi:hypothetical protein